jgi:ABC-type glucose/galactose transport system permease subunit
MIPQIPSKQLLSIRAITTIVFEKIVDETAEINMVSISEIVPFSSPVNTLYTILLVYYIHSYYRRFSEDTPTQRIAQGNSTRASGNRITKREKMTELNKYILSDTGYNFIKACLLVLFFIIRDPKPAV